MAIQQRGADAQVPQLQMRAAARLGADYVLRSILATREAFGLDLQEAFVFLAILQANVAHLDDHVTPAPFNGPPPDGVRKPISVLALSGSTGLPYETTRRTVAGLQAAGLCRRGPRGVIVPADVLTGQPHTAALLQNWVSLRRLTKRLAAGGILEVE